jgi:hypothetical protein
LNGFPTEKGVFMGRIVLTLFILFYSFISSHGGEITLDMIKKTNEMIFYAQQAIEFLQFDLERDETFSEMVMNRTTMEDIRRHKSANLANKETILSKLSLFPSDFSRVISIISEEVFSDREIIGLSSRLGKSLQIVRNRLISGIKNKREAIEELRNKLQELKGDLERMKKIYYGTERGTGQ